MVNTSIVEGYWYGFYNYMTAGMGALPLDAGGANATAFRAHILCGADGQVRGSIVDERARELHAVLDGTFDGQTLSFVKRYTSAVDVFGGKGEPVQYVGLVSPDGTILSGTWTLRGKLLFVIPLTGSGSWQAQRYIPAY